jgi:hypothetical protein
VADDRGVTEVLGFILVFSLVLGTVALVYVGGFAELKETRVHEQDTNAERAFDVLADNLEEIGRDKAPSRATEVKLSESELRIGDTTNRRIEVTANGSTAAAQPRPIVYESSGGTQIVYEYGAVLRQDSGGTVMVRQPDYVFDAERTVVRYLEPRGGEQSTAGSKTVLVRAERSHSRLLASETNASGVDVAFNVTTEEGRADAWERYLEAELENIAGADACSQDPVADADAVVVACEFETDAVHVARTRLVVELL